MKVTYQHEYKDGDQWFSLFTEKDSIEKLESWEKWARHITTDPQAHRIVKITREVVEGPND